ncbi:MAG: polysaccharide deacetylase family protein [Acidimicrobiia bacterium]|nr:polysaccharide deacetylase family protein [Acidimicrobiia bacterium]
MSHRLNVFCWHNIDTSPCFPQVDGAGVRGFERQLLLLRRVGTPVGLGAGLDALQAGVPLPPRAFAVTFDDGYRDNLELAAPLLHRLGVPATVFLVPALLSGESRAWWEQLAWAIEAATAPAAVWEGRTYELSTPAARRAVFTEVAERVKVRCRDERERAVAYFTDALEPRDRPGDTDLFLDWEGAHRLVAAGWEIGSHSLRHAILSQESPHEQRVDLLESRTRLARELGVDVSLLAYPNGAAGDFDEITVGAAKEAGYRYAVTTIDGHNTARTPPYRLKRYVMYPEYGTAWFGRLARDRLRRLTTHHLLDRVTPSKTSATSVPSRGRSNRVHATS